MLRYRWLRLGRARYVGRPGRHGGPIPYGAVGEVVLLPRPGRIANCGFRWDGQLWAVPAGCLRMVEEGKLAQRRLRTCRGQDKSHGHPW